MVTKSLIFLACPGVAILSSSKLKISQLYVQKDSTILHGPDIAHAHSCVSTITVWLLVVEGLMQDRSASCRIGTTSESVCGFWAKTLSFVGTRSNPTNVGVTASDEVVRGPFPNISDHVVHTVGCYAFSVGTCGLYAACHVTLRCLWCAGFAGF